MRHSAVSLLAILLLLFAGCTWVKLTPEGEKIRVLDAEEVTSCKRIGKTTAFGKASVARVERNKEKVAEEFSYLARNSAAEMGGDTIVPITEIEGDQQTFAVLRCVNP